MGSVSPNSVRAKPAPSAVVATAFPLEITVQCSGATTEIEKRAFRSGCSKQAYARRASAASNWV